MLAALFGYPGYIFIPSTEFTATDHRCQDNEIIISTTKSCDWWSLHVRFSWKTYIKTTLL